MKSYLLAIMACAAVACVEPTSVRRTLLIPAPTLPARVGAPLDPGHGRAALELSSVAVTDAVYDFDDLGDGEYGDPGVLVPDFHVGASFHFGAFRFWEPGVRVLYAHATWSDANFGNVIDLPKRQDRGLYEIALSHRFNVLRDFGPGEAFDAALLAELGVGSAPEAVFCDSCQGEPSADPSYVVHRTSEHLFLKPQLAALIGAYADERIFVDGLIGMTTSLRNIGFDSIEHIDDDTDSSFLVGYVGAGIDVRYEPVFVTLHMYFPFDGQREITFGPRLSLQAGYAF